MDLGYTNKVFVTPNYPLKKETEDVQQPNFHKELSSVYAGIEGNQPMPHRNIEGFVDMFSKLDIGNLTIMGSIKDQKSAKRIRYAGILPRTNMYKEMGNHCIGLVPFKAHWSHKCIRPNKAYEYAHAGLIVMCTSLVTISKVLAENCVTFDNYEEMASKLEYYKENMKELYRKRLNAFRFAKNHLVWEKYERNIIKCLSIMLKNRRIIITLLNEYAV